jgi:hypothetical protein
MTTTSTPTKDLNTQLVNARADAILRTQTPEQIAEAQERFHAAGLERVRLAAEAAEAEAVAKAAKEAAVHAKWLARLEELKKSQAR